MIHFDQPTCRDLNLALGLEWLETNGLGGFASSTIAGLNTRRYHGLLVAATQPPAGRMVLLSKLEETLVIDGRRHELSANRYPGVVHPQGHLYLDQFRLDPSPVFAYQMEGLILEKTVFMIQGENSTVIEYRLRLSPGAQLKTCTLELRPLIAFRDYHGTTHENGALDPHLDIAADSVKVAPYPGLPPLYLIHSGGEVRQSGWWYRNFEYDRERERGLDFREDLFQPFVLTFDLSRDPHPTVIASTGRRPGAALPAPNRTQPAPTDPFTQALVRAAGQFIVRRGEHTTVIAGYHWFCDWGRDTMISLPGLTLAAGRYDLAKSILLAFAPYVDRGMLPNRFPDAGETPEYNTVDATLWFFEAVRALLAYTDDYEFVRSHLYAMLADILSWHERGTRYGIRLDSDGLLLAGEPGVQLTWMDARVGDWVVTPRQGKPVEIQALWYNALRVMEHLAQRYGDRAHAGRWREIADRARLTFPPLFWNESAGCLYDVVDGGARDASIRPNQILAVSLFHSMLPLDQAKSVVDCVERRLLTPYGLRTLDPGDPRYRGTYGGDPMSRDSAYHQGTVWPWLMGPFLTAWLKVHGRSGEARQQARLWLAELQRYLREEGLGQLPEVFEGDPPHRAGGCIAQAWSVAELLRVCVEHISETAPAPRGFSIG